MDAAGVHSPEERASLELVGNAVTTRVAGWVASRLSDPGDPAVDLNGRTVTHPWPAAAWGDAGERHKVSISEFPVLAPYEHLSSVVDLGKAAPLSARAINGFSNRLMQGNLGRHEGFREDVARYRDAMWSLRHDEATLPLLVQLVG